MSIFEDDKIKTLFEEAIHTFEIQKAQISIFIKNDGFPIPIGFTDSDLKQETMRLFSDIFCLHYLNIMSLHGLLGHITSLSSSVRKDLRCFYDSCDDAAKKMYHQTTELLLEKGLFQRDPYFYPKESPEFVQNQLDGFFGDKVN